MVEQRFCKPLVAGSNPVGGLSIKRSMIINLWHNKEMNQWRWSLTNPSTMEQHTGGQSNLRTAMNDIVNTVEYILSQNE